MKHFLRIWFVCLLLFVFFDGVGQSSTNLDCGTKPQTHEVSKNLLKAYQDYQSRTKTALSPSPTNIVYVPVIVHDIYKLDGTGKISSSDLTTIFTILNSKYSSVGIQFYRPYFTDFIQSDYFYNYGDVTSCGSSKEASLCSTRDYTNAINIYFVGSITDASGFAKFPTFCDGNTSRKEDNRIFIGKNSSLDFISKYVVPHEFGHYFSLFHTFREDGLEPFELVTRGSGRNCYSVADQLCDTDADPYIRNSGMDNCKRLNIFTGNCFWGGSTYGCNYIDSNNQSYTPPINNQMSYWTRDCLDNLGFTYEQYQRIASGYDFRVLNPNPTFSQRYYLDGQRRVVIRPFSSNRLLCAGGSFSFEYNLYGEPNFVNASSTARLYNSSGSYYDLGNVSAGLKTITIPSNITAGYYDLRIYNSYASPDAMTTITLYINGANNTPTGSPIYSQYSNATSTNYNATSTCAGNNIGLNVNESGYDTYWWTKDGQNITASSTSSYFNASSTGTYTLNMMKCGNVYRSSNSIYLRFYEPTPSLTASSNGALTDFRLATCEGSPVMLSAGCQSGMNTLWNDGSTSSIRYLTASSTRDFFVNCNNYFCNKGYAPPVRIIALNPNVQSTKTGNWQDATLWSSNLVPLNCQTVTIQAGHTVNVPINDAKAKNIIIRGNLNFQNFSPTIKGKVGLGI
ncbi:pregnancy-associated plasma protein-A [Arcicella aurantiaca]|uniref:Pregnancy-associated plasma protein-A n=1 Tax=Arcicella aurantiaca TaxID=591202 RepID=A0A316EFC1_9BACT|nr:M43 family zinc metalloprotease [Arcicella aurantiaca]PWK28952.1 pregnancy-associated plasma protein-A [Arcicella aurantiaca]